MATRLLIAAAFDNRIEVAIALLEHAENSADVNYKNKDGFNGGSRERLWRDGGNISRTWGDIIMFAILKKFPQCNKVETNEFGMCVVSPPNLAHSGIIVATAKIRTICKMLMAFLSPR